MKIIFFVVILLLVKENLLLPGNRITTRSFGGKPVRRLQFPHQVIIFTPITPGTEYGYRCSGALISDQHVLTCAHCLYDIRKKYPVYVDLGAYELFNNEEEGRKRLEIAKDDVLIHINYDKRTRANDIALVKLPEKVQFNEYIQPVALPDSSMINLIGQNVILSGWGHTGDGVNNDRSETLHYITSQIISPISCTNYFGGEFFSHKRQICMNEEGKSACRGDSGSPLVVITPGNSYVLVGIHSFGHKTGCETGIPQVSGRVTYFLDWIQKNTA